MKNNFKFKTLAIITLLCLVFLTGCSKNKALDEGSSHDLKLKIGALPVEDMLPILVAKEEGYFNEENLDVELIPFQSAVECESAIQSEKLDGMVTDVIVAALLKDSGLDAKITSITLGATPKEGRFAIVAAPNSNISKPSDLKGKEVGISYNSIIEYVTDGLLGESGLEPHEINKVSIAKIPIRMEMLLNNKIDAVVVPDPLVTYAEFEGANIVAEDTKGKNLSQAVIIFTDKVLTENAPAVEAFYRAYKKAVEAINSKPEKFKKLLVENVSIPEPIIESYNVQKYPEPQLPESEDIERVIQWLNEKELLRNDLDYNSLVFDIIPK